MKQHGVLSTIGTPNSYPGMADMGTCFEYLRQLNMASMVLRIVLAMLMGGLVGFERERKRRPAGFRTYMLVALGAALTMILSQYLNLMLNTQWAAIAEGSKTDVSRFGAQVINGVGFLGAGTIIVTGRQEVKGLTTAAGLWASACMGLAIGAGFYECMIVGFLLIELCMRVLPFVENWIMAKARNLNIYIEMDSIENLGNIVGRMKAEDITIYDVEIDKQQQAHMSQINALFYVRLPQKQQHTEILARLSMLDGIISIEEV